MITDKTLFEYLDITALDFLFVGLVEVRSEWTKNKSNTRHEMLPFILDAKVNVGPYP